jgi:glycosyltransferase involved in cell wall biosynthesis
VDLLVEAFLRARESEPGLHLLLAGGGPLSLIEDRVSGRLCEPDAQDVAGALVELVRSPLLRRRLASSGRAAALARTWDGALARLADGYERLLARPEALEETGRAA